MRWLALLLLLAAPARAQDAPPESIVLGLSADRVAITATFDGSDILLFGAVRREAPVPDGPLLEVVVTVSGPLRPVTVRQATRRGGLWLNTGTALVDAAPSFYAVATTAPLAEVLSQTEDLRHAITIPQAIRAVGTGVEDRQGYLDALVRIRTREGAYRVLQGGVDLDQDTLFRASIDLPANLIEGDYRARIFLTRGGRVVDSYETDIAVAKVGIERWLHALAVGQPFLYGLLALGLAVAAGWGAQLAFDARR